VTPDDAEEGNGGELTDGGTHRDCSDRWAARGASRLPRTCRQHTVEDAMTEQSDLPRTSDEVGTARDDAVVQEEDQRPPEDQGDDEWPSEADRDTPDSAEPGDAAES